MPVAAPPAPGETAPAVVRPRPAAPAADPRGGRRLRVVDVAMWFGERSGGIKTYLEAKREHAAATGAFEHHLVVPGAAEEHRDRLHRLPGVRVTANGYRIPWSGRALARLLRGLHPDVVLLHDPFWSPARTARTARAAGALVVAVHHGSVAMDAAGLRGPDRLWAPPLRAWLHRAAGRADVVMSHADPRADCGRPADLPLRLGLPEAFRPRAGTRRGDEVLYVGRLVREKGVLDLLAAAARSTEPWPLRLVGEGALRDELPRRAAALGIGDRVRVEPYVDEREALARAYREASCVVVPGAHETFGLVALEAAASGGRVVVCATAPAAATIGALGVPAPPHDPAGLAAAIEEARTREPDAAAARALGARHGWSRCLHAEEQDVRALLARR